MDKKTGAILWSYDIKKDGRQVSFHGNPLVTEDLIIIGTDGGFQPETIGHIYAFERKTGKVRWKYQTSLGVPTDIVRDGKRILATSMSDELLCLDLETGKIIWSFPSGAAINNTFTQPPLVIGKRVFWGTLTGEVFALEKESGKVIWKQKLGTRISTSFAFNGEDLYVGTIDGKVFRLKQKTGETVGEHNFNGFVSGTLTLADNTLFVLNNGTQSYYSTFSALDLDLKKVRWERKGEWFTPRPLVHKNSVYLGEIKGDVSAFRLYDGEKTWSHKVVGETRSFGLADNLLFIGTLRGTVYAYQIE